jgi:hypothetical protein
MAGERGTPYISVLDRNMSNPDYRKQVEQQQALQGSYPELVVAPALKTGVNAVKNLSDKAIALATTNAQKQVSKEMLEGQTTVAMKSLSNKEYLDWVKGKGLPPDFNERVKNASIIGSRINSGHPSPFPIPKKPALEKIERIASESTKNASRRMGFEMANPILYEIERQRNLSKPPLSKD